MTFGDPSPDGNTFWDGVARAQSKWHDYKLPEWEQPQEFINCAPDLICGACGKCADQHETYMREHWYRLCDGVVANCLQVTT